jgi:hypothetical protein
MNPLAKERRPESAVRLRLSGLAVLLAGLLGCQNSQPRLQAPDEPEHDRYDQMTVGSITQVGNAEPVRLQGVGLVADLDGTGGECSPEIRAVMEDQMRRMRIPRIKELLASTEYAVVIVNAELRPGSNKGDKIDVVVSLPQKTKATSLRGGYLMKCVLYNYDFAGHLNPATLQDPNMALRGHAMATAEGPVLIGCTDGDEAMRVRQGRIWNGGQVALDWPLSLDLKPDQQTGSWAGLVAQRVNEAFDGGLRGGNGGEIAHARDNIAIPLRVPVQYKLNQQHYLRVVRAIPLSESANRTDAEGKTYRQRLGDDLLKPSQTLAAALRLEALGPSSVPQLQPGLKSDHPLVRFAAAQALAYLNSTSAAEELARLIETQPALRAYGLVALAALDESVAEDRLQNLLSVSPDDETRYGAFRALQTRNEKNPLVKGVFVNGSYHLHRLMPNTLPLVHVCSVRRAEIVVFGEEPRLLPPFQFLAGDFTITADAGDDRCVVSRHPTNGRSMKKQCSLRLMDVMLAMADMGGMFPETVDLLQQASQCKCMSCRVVSNAMPRATNVYELAKDATKSESDILNTTPTAEAAPTLFEAGGKEK